MKILSMIRSTRFAFAGLMIAVFALAASGLSAQTALTDGVPVNGNVAGGADDFYTIAVPAGQTSMDIDVDFAGGDIIDMLVSFNQAPHYGSPWSFHYAIGNAAATGEHMTLHLDTGAVQGMPALQTGTWHILIRGFGAGGAYTIEADHEGSTALTKDVAVNGDITNADSGYYNNLTGAMAFDNNDYYSFDIPDNAPSVTFDLTGLSADLNIYARNGSVPVINGGSYDASSVTAGSVDEQIVVNSPAAGTWYLVVDGASNAESSYTVKADYDATALSDGVAVNGNVAGGKDHLYKITTPANVTKLAIDVTFAGGDIIDMLVSKDAIPHYGSPWAFNYAIGNADTNGEHMTIHRDTGLAQGMPAMQAATWYILLRGFGTGGAYTLTADYTQTELDLPLASTIDLSNCTPVNDAITNADNGWHSNLTGGMAFDENDYYKINVPASQSNLMVKLTGLSADLNIYVMQGAVPVVFTGSYTWSSTNAGSTDELLTINAPTAGIYWIVVDGAANAESSYIIEACYSAGSAVTTDVLLQGEVNQKITFTGSGFTNTTGVDLGVDVTVQSFSVINDSQLDVYADTAHLADAGDRAITITTTVEVINTTAKIEFPTNIIPTVTNSEPSRNPATGGINVFLTNGAFFKSETDIATRGRMMGLSFSRFYRSDIALNGPLGNGWTGHHFQRAIWNSSTQHITWYTSDGRGEVFDWNGTDWSSPIGVYVNASRDGGTGVITLTDRHGFKCAYNSDGRLEACIDRNGNTSSCAYNSDGQLITITDDRSYTYTISYYSHGRVQTVTDNVWNGTRTRVIDYVYDANGDLIQQKSPETDRYNDVSTNRTTYAYSYVDHNLTTCTNPREVESGGSSYMENSYDSFGRVIQQRLGTAGQNIYLRYETGTLIHEVDRRGLRTSCTLDAQGRVTTMERYTDFWTVDITDPIDHSQLTAAGNKVRVGDPVKYSTSSSYNTNHETLSVTYPRGNSVEYVYDTSANHLASGNVLTTTRKDNALGSLADIVSTYTYQASHQFVATATNPRGYTTSYSYDANGNLTQVDANTVDLGQPVTQQITTTTTYDSFGQPTLSTDGEGNTTSYVYFTSGDNNGFLKQRITAPGTLDITSEYEYDRVGNLVATWSPRAFEAGPTKDDNFKSSFEVNELNQTWHSTGKVLTIGGSARSESYSYFDLTGNRTHGFREYVARDPSTDIDIEPAAPSDVNNPATFTKSANAMAATWVESSRTYNLLNYGVTSTVDAIAGPTITQYTTSVEFDDNYNRTASITALGFRHETTYDERDLTHTSTAAAGVGGNVTGTYTTDYDLNGNVSKTLDALNNQSTFLYDGFDRTTRVTDAAGHYSTSSYDPNSNTIENKAFNVGNTLLAHSKSTFDEFDRGFKSETLAKDHLGANIGDGWRTSTTLLDMNSRTVTSTDDNGVVTIFEYDTANRTTKSTDNVGNTVIPELNLESVALKTHFKEMNDVTGLLEASHTEQDVDYLNRTIKYRDRRYNAGVLDTEVRSVFDGWSRTVKFEDAAGTESFSEYDLLSRTTRATRKPSGVSGEWIITDRKYDDDSRVLNTTTWNDPDIFLMGQTTSYLYDERNRLTTLTRPDGDIFSSTFDVQSNQTGWSNPLGTSVVDSFDARNLRSSRVIVRGAGIVGPTAETYTFDGLRRLTFCNNHDGADLISSTTHAYNTLSMVEKIDQTTAASAGVTLGTHTTKAEYDATGFRTASNYWDARKVVHARDGLNRLQSSTEDSSGVVIASYKYVGPNRILERLFGNGTKTEYEYESAGCGCGGSTAFINRVEHSVALNGEVLFGVDRRYDVNGSLTVERFDHEGGLGVVYRRDDTYRLRDTFYGVDVSGTNIDTLADTANNPSEFALHRNYNLDPRSNRNGASAVTEKDDTGTTIYDYSYSLSTDDMDLYTDVDGDTYNYDDIEQRTFDAATGLHYAYDYRGYLWHVDTDADLATPEQVYHHDCAGNRVLEEGWYDDAPRTNVHKTVLVNDIRGGGCGSGNGESKSGEIRYNSLNTVASSVQYVFGKGKSSIVHELATNGTDTIERYRHEDQAGSLVGVTDKNGLRTDEYFYLDFGTPIHRPIAFDGQNSRIASVQANTPFPGMTRVNLVGGISIPANSLNGKQVRVLGSMHVNKVLSSSSTVIDLNAPDGDLYTELNAGSGFVVMDFESPEVYSNASGTWTEVFWDNVADETVFIDENAFFMEGVNVGDLLRPDSNIPDIWFEIVAVVDNTTIRIAGDKTAYTGFDLPYDIKDSIWDYDSLTDTSTYTNENAYFEQFQAGWLFTPDVTKPAYLQVISVDLSGESITVKGNATNLSNPDDQWRIHAPPGVDPTTGGQYVDLTDKGLKYLLSGARYMTPQVGYYISGVLHGEQSGLNLTGNYFGGHVIYDPTKGVAFQAAGDSSAIPPDAVATPPGYEHLVDKSRPWPEPDASEPNLPEWPILQPPIDRSGPCCCCVENVTAALAKNATDGAKGVKATKAVGMAWNFVIRAKLLYRGSGDTLSDCTIEWNEQWDWKNWDSNKKIIGDWKKGKMSERLHLPKNKGKGATKAWFGRKKECGTRETVDLPDNPTVVFYPFTKYRARKLHLNIVVKSAKDCDCPVKEVEIKLEQLLVMQDGLAKKDKSHLKQVDRIVR